MSVTLVFNRNTPEQFTQAAELIGPVEGVPNYVFVRVGQGAPFGIHIDATKE